MAITAISFAQTQKATNLLVGDTSGAVEATAELEVESTTKGFLPPRMTNAQMTAIASPAEGLIVYCTNCTPKGIYVSNGQGFADMSGTPDQTGVAAGEVRSSTGLIWQDKNLGATQVATSSTDAASYGTLYQWGRATDGHEVRTSATTSTTVTSDTPGHGDFITATTATDFNWTDFAGEDNLWQGVAGINNPCGAGYRLPSNAELYNERLTFATNNAAGAFNSPLSLPLAGYRDRTTGALSNLGTNGYYWSSTVSGTNARTLSFNSSTAGMYTNNRAYGFSVRCLKD